MKAMILAAGLGTRLRPLTDHCPKALVKIAGHTLLEITLQRLRDFGIHDVIINVHHLGGMLVDYVRKNAGFGMRIQVSQEDVLLDTGGGLKKASWFFLEGTHSEPFLLHNVDVLSRINFGQMLQFHTAHNALATLAVQRRKTSRPLLFNEKKQLCGRGSGQGPGQDQAVEAAAQATQALAFSGVHVISPRLLAQLHEQGAFSIIDAYLRLASEGENIVGFPADDYYWRDLGKPESLTAAEEDVAQHLLQLE